MPYIAYVSTKDGDSLAVRKLPDGEKIDSLINGTEVTVSSER